MKHQNSPIIPLTFLSEYSIHENNIRSMSCVRIKQRSNRIVKSLAILCCLLIVWLFSGAVFAEENKTSFASMWLENTDGTKRIASEALSTTIKMSISGPILRATVKQTFRNPSQSWLEGIYSFPLPEGAAVDQLRMVVGDRIIVGQIQEKQAAKKTYHDARKNGQRTSLLNHQRTNIFTSSVANIGPDEDITIEFEYQQIIDFRDYQYSLRFPMVSTPKYTPPSHLGIRNQAKPIDSTHITTSTPSNPISIEIDLKPGFPIDLPTSISHPITVKKITQKTPENTHYHIQLKGSAALSNRDFILSWKLNPSSKPIANILREDVNGESYGLLMIMPPKVVTGESQHIPRELIWVLDVSGSMQGESIEQARSAILKAISSLKTEDYFNIICFNSHAWKLFPQSRAAHIDNLNLARDKILNLEANGGTNMRPALDIALDKNQTSERLRQVIFVTDGAVNNEAELFRQIQKRLGNSRLFTVGIGSAPNSFFMRKAAIAGKGSFTYISQTKEVSQKITQLLKKLESPVLTDVGFDINTPHASVLPATLPDVYLGEPVYISFKADHFPNYAELTGNLNGIPSNLRLSLHRPIEHKGVAIEWVRRKLSELINRYQNTDSETQERIRQEAIDLALTHHQVSKFTSLVAVDERKDRAGGQLNSKHIPANLPKGWVNQKSTSHPGIRLAQTATNLPYHISIGTTLISLSILWLIGLVLSRRYKARYSS